MVIGLDVWQAHFKDFPDRYVLVGGVACDLLMDEAGLVFRATKDLDVVLLVEVLDAAFAQAFWAFVEAGGYERKEKGEGSKLYRFAKPSTAGYPFMIELFSRAPEGFDLAEGSQLTPLPIDETVASLSAILLDEAYYGLLKTNLRELAGLPLLHEAALIPFKARAYLDLSARKAAGDRVDSGDVKKHRNDVFRLLQLLPADGALDLPETIVADMRAFLAAVAADDAFKPADIQLPMSREEALARLSSTYRL
jgi:hypothetical protein